MERKKVFRFGPVDVKDKPAILDYLLKKIKCKRVTAELIEGDKICYKRQPWKWTWDRSGAAFNLYTQGQVEICQTPQGDELHVSMDNPRRKIRLHIMLSFCLSLLLGAIQLPCDMSIPDGIILAIIVFVWLFATLCFDLYVEHGNFMAFFKNRVKEINKGEMKA